jgi:hypothetical protein
MIRPQEGFGPISGIGVDFGCVIAGKDPIAIDATACRMVGLDINRVHYFESARDRGFGNFEEERIEIRGKKIEEVFKHLWLPYLGGFDQWPEYNIDAENACSSCQGLLAFTLERLKATGHYDKNAGITILLGPKKSLPEGVAPEDLILVGSCLKKYHDLGVYVEGCPPAEPGPMEGILNRKESRLYLDDNATPSNIESRRESWIEMQRAFLEHQKELKKKADTKD